MSQYIKVRCEFDPSGKDLQELLEASFRLYLQRILAEYRTDEV
mgnify:CR=1 FL=1